MNITDFQSLLEAARQQTEQQRLLLVFTRAELPDDATAEQRAALPDEAAATAQRLGIDRRCQRARRLGTDHQATQQARRSDQDRRTRGHCGAPGDDLDQDEGRPGRAQPDHRYRAVVPRQDGGRAQRVDGHRGDRLRQGWFFVPDGYRRHFAGGQAVCFKPILHV